jgi:HK97 family phage prohead protease
MRRRETPSENELQRRTFTLEQFRLDEGDEASAGTASGRAIVYEQKSVEMWGFHELIRRGAATKTLREADIRALANHDVSQVIGRNRSSPPTLRLAEDDAGVTFEADLPLTTYGRDLAVSLRRGDITQCSFGFWPVKSHWELDDEKDLLVVDELRLAEISIVTFPAYEQTTAALRAVMSSHPAAERLAPLFQPLLRLADERGLGDEDLVALAELRSRIDACLTGDPGQQAEAAAESSKPADGHLARLARRLDLEIARI